MCGALTRPCRQSVWAEGGRQQIYPGWAHEQQYDSRCCTCDIEVPKNLRRDAVSLSGSRTKVLLLHFKERKTAMSRGAEAPPLPQRKSSYKWKKTHGLSPESQHAEADHERRASRAAPRGQAHVSQVTPSWQLRVGPWLCRST